MTGNVGSERRPDISEGFRCAETGQPRLTAPRVTVEQRGVQCRPLMFTTLSHIVVTRRPSGGSPCGRAYATPATDGTVDRSNYETYEGVDQIMWAFPLNSPGDLRARGVKLWREHHELR